jgi:hypothetical protein
MVVMMVMMMVVVVVVVVALWHHPPFINGCSINYRKKTILIKSMMVEMTIIFFL